MQEKIATIIATHIEGDNSPFNKYEGGSGHITDCRNHYMKLAKKVINIVRQLDNAPDWSKASPSAKYVAQDQDGQWHWFSKKPQKDLWDACWYLDKSPKSWNGKPRKVVSRYWAQTLSKRPKRSVNDKSTTK